MRNDNIISILITALGGEGGGTLMNWILNCARSSGLYVQGTSVPGVAQRTGSTSYYIEICNKKHENEKKPILSLYPKPGRVDVVISSELLEAARTIEKGYVNPEKTVLISSSTRTYTNLEKIHTADGRFDIDKIMETCKKMSKKFIQLDLNKIAIDNSTIVSASMFGALAAANIFPWSKDVCEEVFNDDVLGKNSLSGFNSAFQLVNRENKFNKVKKDTLLTDIDTKLKTNITSKIQKDIPNNLLNILTIGYKRCLEYQNVKYADLYLDRIVSLLSLFNVNNNRDIDLLENIMKRLALWMAYEDIPRVAGLKIHPKRFDKIKKQVNLKNDQLLIIQDIFKPGKNEIAAMLPNKIGKLITNIKIPLFTPFTGKGLKINSLSVLGFIVLKFLSCFKYIRKFSYRYKEEQKNIEIWLNNIRDSIKFSIGYTEGLADMPQILKGYGDTWERGKSKFNKINNVLIKNKNFKNIDENDVKTLKQAISISLNQLESQELDVLLKIN